jgi:hypothetical protein
LRTGGIHWDVVWVFAVQEFKQLKTGIGNGRGESGYGLGGKAAKPDDYRGASASRKIRRAVSQIHCGVIVHSVKEYGFYTNIHKKRGEPLNQTALYKAMFGYDKRTVAIDFASGSGAVKYIRPDDDFRFYPE